MYNPDERQMLLEDGNNKEGRHQQEGDKFTKSVSCPKCSMALYCSNECRREDWKECHKPYCNVPPCRIPTYEEELLIKTVTGDNCSKEDSPAMLDVGGENDDIVMADADDDEDEWEDVDSDDEDGSTSEPPSKTRLIYKFINDKAYKPRGISEL